MILRRRSGATAQSAESREGVAIAESGRGARPVFVFSKGSWIAGVGLDQKDADAVARTFAGMPN